mgnify:CR=1 FL=1
MLTRNDMQRLACSLPCAKQLALDQIMPVVNLEIRAAAALGRTGCTVDIPAFMDTTPAYDYPEVCAAVAQTLRKGEFTVDERQLGLYDVSWGANRTIPSPRPAPGRSDDDEVRIVCAPTPRRRRKRR